jgi:hypothetical protein
MSASTHEPGRKSKPISTISPMVKMDGVCGRIIRVDISAKTDLRATSSCCAWISVRRSRKPRRNGPSNDRQIKAAQRSSSARWRWGGRSIVVCRVLPSSQGARTRQRSRDSRARDGARLPKFVYLEVRKQRAAVVVARQLSRMYRMLDVRRSGGGRAGPTTCSYIIMASVLELLPQCAGLL